MEMATANKIPQVAYQQDFHTAIAVKRISQTTLTLNQIHVVTHCELFFHTLPIYAIVLGKIYIKTSHPLRPSHHLAITKGYHRLSTIHQTGVSSGPSFHHQVGGLSFRQVFLHSTTPWDKPPSHLWRPTQASITLIKEKYLDSTCVHVRVAKILPFEYCLVPDDASHSATRLPAQPLTARISLE